MNKSEMRRTPITKPGWVLLTESGQQVFTGQKAKTFRGEDCTIKGGTPPAHAASTGRVNSNLGEFYPGVFNMEWVPA